MSDQKRILPLVCILWKRRFMKQYDRPMMIHLIKCKQILDLKQFHIWHWSANTISHDNIIYTNKKHPLLFIHSLALRTHTHVHAHKEREKEKERQRKRERARAREREKDWYGRIHSDIHILWTRHFSRQAATKTNSYRKHTQRLRHTHTRTNTHT